MNMRRIWRDLWRPPGQALDTFAAVLSEHWLTATDRTARLFSATPGSWLQRRSPGAPEPSTPDDIPAHHFTRGGRLIR